MYILVCAGRFVLNAAWCVVNGWYKVPSVARTSDSQEKRIYVILWNSADSWYENITNFMLICMNMFKAFGSSAVIITCSPAFGVSLCCALGLFPSTLSKVV
jgi:hypothetical protein